MSVAKLHIKKGDMVLVTSGKDRGKTGKVHSVDIKHSRAVVEGVNIVKRATRPTPNNPQGGFHQVEASVHAAKLRTVCPSCGHPVRIRKKLLEDGSKVRVCHRCGASLDQG